MTIPTKTLYRLEVRPLTLSPFKKVEVWDPLSKAYYAYSLKRGHWFTAHQRMSDHRAVFAGGPGTNRLNSKAWVDKTAASLRKRGFKTRVVPVKYAMFPHLRGDLDADLDVLAALNETAKDLEVTIDVISGGRTRAEQQFLYDLYLAGRGNLAARPGTSRHETGRAVDAYVNGVALAKHKGGLAAAAKHGLSFPVPGESWHCEL